MPKRIVVAANLTGQNVALLFQLMQKGVVITGTSPGDMYPRCGILVDCWAWAGITVQKMLRAAIRVRIRTFTTHSLRTRMPSPVGYFAVTPNAAHQRASNCGAKRRC